MNQGEIKKIYTEYFDLIDSYFGSIKHYLGPEIDSHIDLGRTISTYPLISDLILDAIEDLNASIENFWIKNGTKVFDYVKSQDTLKCVYSGDISPVFLENFVKRTALYIDSVVLPDPIFNMTWFHKQAILDRKYYLDKIIRHVFNVWKLKDLVLADSKDNIIFILPINLNTINSQDRSKIFDNANTKFVDYTGLLFDQNFSDRDSSLIFLDKYKNSEDVYHAIKKQDILPNKFKALDTFAGSMNQFVEAGKYSKLQSNSVGESFGRYLISQFLRVQEHKFFCQRLVAEPIYDYELPWFFFNYEMGGLDMDASIANALHKEKFDWITNLPLPAIKILREENQLDYMRNVLRKGITDLKAKNDDDLIKVSEQLEKNISEEFKKQKAEMGDLKKKISSIFTKDVAFTSGGFLAGLIPHPAIAIPISILSAGRDIYKLLKERGENKKNIKKEKAEFINLLMKSYEKP